MNTVRKLPNSKCVSCVSNWSDYNRALTQRGALSVYLGDDLERTWREGAPTGTAGRPEVYPDTVILLGLVLQQVYRLPLRQTVGQRPRLNFVPPISDDPVPNIHPNGMQTAWRKRADLLNVWQSRRFYY
jgi:hypothetical protein